jgi:hypothetical protein
MPESKVSTNPIGSIADKKACGGATQANTGKLGCLSLFGTPENILLLRKGTKILSSQIFNVELLKTLVLSGKLIPMLESSSFEDASAEDTYSTNTKGIKRLNLKGLPEYKFMFEEGHEYYKEMAKLEGYKNFDFILGDDEGNWMLVISSDGSFKGFTGGHTTPERTNRKVAGGDAESKSLLFQFLERKEFDENYRILHAAELDFVPSEVPVSNGVNLTFDANPAAAGTSFDITAVLSSDNDTPVEALVTVNFQVLVNGVVDAGVSVSSVVAGKYAFTGLTALSSTDVLDVQTWNSAESTNIADLAGTLYRGEATVTIV